jgi:hypothetical protein
MRCWCKVVVVMLMCCYGVAVAEASIGGGTFPPNTILYPPSELELKLAGKNLDLLDLSLSRQIFGHRSPSRHVSLFSLTMAADGRCYSSIIRVDRVEQERRHIVNRRASSPLLDKAENAEYLSTQTRNIVLGGCFNFRLCTYRTHMHHQQQPLHGPTLRQEHRQMVHERSGGNGRVILRSHWLTLPCWSQTFLTTNLQCRDLRSSSTEIYGPGRM